MPESTNVPCDSVEAQEGADYAWQKQVEGHLKCTARRRERPEVQSNHKHPRSDDNTPESELGMAKINREAPEVHGV